MFVGRTSRKQTGNQNVGPTPERMHPELLRVFVIPPLIIDCNLQEAEWAGSDLKQK